MSALHCSCVFVPQQLGTMCLSAFYFIFKFHSLFHGVWGVFFSWQTDENPSPSVALEGLISLWPVKQAEKRSIRTADPCCDASFFLFAIRALILITADLFHLPLREGWRRSDFVSGAVSPHHWNRDRSQHSSAPGEAAADLSDDTCRAKQLPADCQLITDKCSRTH